MRACEQGRRGAQRASRTGVREGVLDVVDSGAVGRTVRVPDGAALLGLLEALDGWGVVAASFDDLALREDRDRDAG